MCRLRSTYLTVAVYLHPRLSRHVPPNRTRPTASRTRATRVIHRTTLTSCHAISGVLTCRHLASAPKASSPTPRSTPTGAPTFPHLAAAEALAAAPRALPVPSAHRAVLALAVGASPEKENASSWIAVGVDAARVRTRHLQAVTRRGNTVGGSSIREAVQLEDMEPSYAERTLRIRLDRADDEWWPSAFGANSTSFLSGSIGRCFDH